MKEARILDQVARLQDLIRSVETSREPDTELDVAVFCLLNPDKKDWKRIQDTTFAPPEDIGGGSPVQVPAYTAAAETAMTAIPMNWYLHLSFIGSPRPWARGMHKLGTRALRGIWGNSLALTILAAALRMRLDDVEQGL